MKILNRGITYGHKDWVAVLPKGNPLHREMLDHFNGDDPTIPWEPSGIPTFHLIPERIVPEEHGLSPAEEGTFIVRGKSMDDGLGYVQGPMFSLAQPDS